MPLPPLPPIPKKLAARIRGAQAKVLGARGWIEGTEFNSVQDEARWAEFTRDREAFSRKYYRGHGVDSYPVQTNTSRLRERLDKLPVRRERNRRELEEADAQLARVEAETLEEIRRMRPTAGRVPWPAPLEPYETFHARVIAKAHHERDTADARREAYLAEVRRDFEKEIATVEAVSQAEFDEATKDMTPSERSAFRRLVDEIASSLLTPPSDHPEPVSRKPET